MSSKLFIYEEVDHFVAWQDRATHFRSRDSRVRLSWSPYCLPSCLSRSSGCWSENCSGCFFPFPLLYHMPIICGNIWTLQEETLLVTECFSIFRWTVNIKQHIKNWDYASNIEVSSTQSLNLVFPDFLIFLPEDTITRSNCYSVC